MTKATVAMESDLPALARALAPADCPMLDQATLDQFEVCRREAGQFSLGILEFLDGRSPQEQAAWLTTSVQASRDLFSPWTMELLFVLATLGRARFTQMHDLLGLSTRTLSNKLKGLRAAGLIEREVYDEQPVRIEYFPTKHGRLTAALASPLFAHVNLETLRRAPAPGPTDPAGPRVQGP